MLLGRPIKLWIIFIILMVIGSFVTKRASRQKNGSLRCRQCNLVVVIFDTLRKDGLSVYAKRANTPRIAEFGESSFVFKHAYSTSCHTAPAHASFFTSTLPSQHGVENIQTTQKGFRKIPQNLVTMAEQLQSSGYITHAVTGGGYVSAAFGFDRGFSSFQTDDAYDNPGLWKSFLASKPKNPFFLFLHTYKVHSPYLPDDNQATLSRCGKPVKGLPMNPKDVDILSAEYLERYPEGKIVGEFWDRVTHPESQDVFTNNDFHAQIRSKVLNGPEIRRQVIDWLVQSPTAILASFWRYIFWYRIVFQRLVPWTEEEIGYLRCLYDQETSEADLWFAQLLDALDQQGSIHPTIIVLLSDHGEEFKEHGKLDHQTLFDEIIAIPLIISLPGQKTSKVVGDMVSIIDLMPTLIDILDLPIPDQAVGRSVLPVLQKTPLEQVPVVAQIIASGKCTSQTLLDYPYKLIKNEESSLLFDLEKDPLEKNDLSKVYPDLTQKMRAYLKCSPE